MKYLLHIDFYCTFASNYQALRGKLWQKIQSNSNSELERLKCFEQLRGLANLRNLQPLIEQLMQSISQYLNKEIDPWFKEGIQIGEQRKNLELILILLTNTDFDDVKIANLASVSEVFVKEIRQKYSKD